MPVVLGTGLRGAGAEETEGGDCSGDADGGGGLWVRGERSALYFVLYL